MKRTEQDYLGLLDETVKFYSEDISRRATTGSGCMYVTKDKRNCAVGRCMTKDALDDLIGSTSSAYDIDRHFGGIDSTLKEKYKGYDISFWSKLQNLHDTENYWDKNGLTADGIAYVQYIQKCIDGKFNNLF